VEIKKQQKIFITFNKQPKHNNMKTIFIVLCSLFTTASLAQTKLIAFKSHSGNMDNFNIALENDLFNSEGSNFGKPSHMNLFRLDSVIYISPTKAVLIGSLYQYPWRGSKDSAKFIQMIKDTVYNDPMFSQKHSLDSIRRQLKNGDEYEDKNAVFIGYDNKKNKAKKKESVNINKIKENDILPVVTTNNDPAGYSPFDTAMLKALAGIFLLAILGGWLSAKFYSLRLQKA
jgi:hypothetical protein